MRKTSTLRFPHTAPFRQGLSCRFWCQNRLKRRASRAWRKSGVFRQADSRPKWMVETPKGPARLERSFRLFLVRPVTVKFGAFRLFWPNRENMKARKPGLVKSSYPYFQIARDTGWVISVGLLVPAAGASGPLRGRGRPPNVCRGLAHIGGAWFKRSADIV
jgi:hypothetical protein